MQPPVSKGRPLFAYWVLFSYFAAGSLLTNRAGPAGQRRASPLLLVGALLVILLVGLRYEVGADWEAYEHIFWMASFADLDQVLARKDPGYQVLNWIVAQLKAEIWLVNLVCAAIFGWGLYRLARIQPWPWLAYLVATPYLVVVVANGYTRQAVAIGIIMAGIARFSRDSSVLRFALYVGIAALFHKTAVVVLLLVAFASQRNTLINTILTVAAFLLFYDIFLEESVEYFYTGYIERGYSSQGAAIRLAMNMVASVLMLWKGKMLELSPQELRIWRNFAIANIVLVVAFFFTPSSTAVDRLALYLIPIQIVALSRAPLLFKQEMAGRITVIAYCFAVQFTWLNFASHAEAWLPYQIYPFR